MNLNKPIYKILIGKMTDQELFPGENFWIVRYHDYGSKIKICTKMNHVLKNKPNELIMLSLDNIEEAFSSTYPRWRHEGE